ncbi:MAG: 30S ribosomal protein S17 [Candidatus Omnitrophica bacterium]|nr:30S ribosomal protein S17 [Candidatus Omnitrophota bacterium]
MKEPKKRKERIGVVVSDRMNKTIVVKVTRTTHHPLYNRIIKKYKKFKVHDEKNVAKVGDLVRIQETRPISKEKYFRLKEIIKKAGESK